MFAAVANLPPAHQAYLVMVVAAFAAFGVTLGVVSTWTNLSR